MVMGDGLLVGKAVRRAEQEREHFEDELKGFGRYSSAIQNGNVTTNRDYLVVFKDLVWDGTDYSSINRDEDLTEEKDVIKGFLIEYENLGRTVLANREADASFLRQEMLKKTEELKQKRRRAEGRIREVYPTLNEVYNDLREIAGKAEQVETDLDNWNQVERWWNNLEIYTDSLEEIAYQHQQEIDETHNEVTDLLYLETEYPVLHDVGLIRSNIEEKRSELLQNLPVEAERQVNQPL